MQQIISPTASIVLLREALTELGYDVHCFTCGKKYFTRFTSPQGNVWITSDARVVYPFASTAAKEISDNKNLAYELAGNLHILYPQTIVIDETTDVQTKYDMLKKSPLVVKPVDGYASHGLTLDIVTAEQLDSGLQKAREYSPQVLIQQQVQGQEIRFAVLNGKVDGAVLRQTPRVVGDGVSTVAQLIASENTNRRNLQMPYLSYPLLEAPLISLEPDFQQRTPSNTEVVELGRSTMIRGGASVYDVTKQVHPSYTTTVERLAAEFGKGFVVVDLFVRDYTIQQTDDNYVFMECNMSPALKLFYSCRDGKHYDILKQLVPLIDESLNCGAAR